ncbi:MAG TPA: cell wall hydrolase [Caulobacteraceae bacterium]
MAGGRVQQASEQARIQRLAKAAAAGFSESALQQSTSAMAPGALAVARRQDPSLEGARTDRPAALQATKVSTGPTLTSGPAAQPFKLSGVLESSRDLDCLTAAVYYEAGSDTAAGQAAVAQVVLNRVRHPSFPKTVCGVVYQGAASGHCQFSFICDGAMRRAKSPAMWESARKVAVRALGGYVMTQAGEAVSFHAAYLGRMWSSMQVVGRIGAHQFYRFGAHGGGTGAFQGGVYAVERRPDPAVTEPADRPVYASASDSPTADGAAVAHLASLTAAPSAASAGQPASATVPVSASKPAADAPAKAAAVSTGAAS